MGVAGGEEGSALVRAAGYCLKKISQITHVLDGSVKERYGWCVWTTSVWAPAYLPTAAALAPLLPGT